MHRSSAPSTLRINLRAHTCRAAHTETTDLASPTPSLPEALPEGAKADLILPPTDPPEAAIDLVAVSPRGAVDEVQEIRLTFSAPPDHAHTHAELKPNTPGVWEWRAPCALCFCPDDVLPRATEWRVHVRWRDGDDQEHTHAETFTTVAPTLVGMTPSEDELVAGRPHISLLFDQPVVADAICAYIEVRDASGKLVPCTHTARRHTDALRHDPEATVTIQPDEALTPLSRYDIIVRQGAPGAQGPRRTQEDQIQSVRCARAFEFVEVRGGWDGMAQPDSPFILRFTTPLSRTFDPAYLTIEPEPPTPPVVKITGRELHVRAPWPGSTRHTITLATDTRDIFGQRLGAPVSAELSTAGASPHISLLGEEPITTLDADTGALPVEVVGHESVRVRGWHVGLDDLNAYIELARRGAQSAAKLTAHMPGALILDEVLQLDTTEVGASAYTEVPVADALAAHQREVGHVIIHIEPKKSLLGGLLPFQDHVHDGSQHRWVQVTHHALEATAGTDTLVARVTRIHDGRPCKGAEVWFDQRGDPAITDAAGLAHLRLPMAREQRFEYMIARIDKDTVILPRTSNLAPRWTRWTRRPPASARCWIAPSPQCLDADATWRITGCATPAQRAEALRWRLRDAAGDVLRHGALERAPDGTFTVEFARLPAPPTTLSFEVYDGDGDDAIATREVALVEDLAQAHTDRPLLDLPETGVTNEEEIWTARATPHTALRWDVRARAARGTLTGWEGWSLDARMARGLFPPPHEAKASMRSTLDEDGDHEVAVTLDTAVDVHPVALLVCAGGARARCVRWPSARLVALRADATAAIKGDSITIEVASLTHEGASAPEQTVTCKLYRVSSGEHHLRRYTTLTTGDDGRAQWTIALDEDEAGGAHLATATVTDVTGRRHVSALTLTFCEEATHEAILCTPMDALDDMRRLEVIAAAPTHAPEAMLLVRRGRTILANHTLALTPTPSRSHIELPPKVQHGDTLTLQLSAPGPAGTWSTATHEVTLAQPDATRHMWDIEAPDAHHRATPLTWTVRGGPEAAHMTCVCVVADAGATTSALGPRRATSADTPTKTRSTRHLLRSAAARMASPHLTLIDEEAEGEHLSDAPSQLMLDPSPSTAHTTSSDGDALAEAEAPDEGFFAQRTSDAAHVFSHMASRSDIHEMPTQHGPPHIYEVTRHTLDQDGCVQGTLEVTNGPRAVTIEVFCIDGGTATRMASRRVVLTQMPPTHTRWTPRWLRPQDVCRIPLPPGTDGVRATPSEAVEIGSSNDGHARLLRIKSDDETPLHFCKGEKQVTPDVPLQKCKGAPHTFHIALTSSIRSDPADPPSALWRQAIAQICAPALAVAHTMDLRTLARKVMIAVGGGEDAAPYIAPLLAAQRADGGFDALLGAETSSPDPGATATAGVALGYAMAWGELERAGWYPALRDALSALPKDDLTVRLLAMRARVLLGDTGAADEASELVTAHATSSLTGPQLADLLAILPDAPHTQARQHELRTHVMTHEDPAIFARWCASSATLDEDAAQACRAILSDPRALLHASVLDLDRAAWWVLALHRLRRDGAAPDPWRLHVATADAATPRGDGLVISRTYTPRGDATTLRVGDRVDVTLTVSATRPCGRAVIHDLLPACLKPIGSRQTPAPHGVIVPEQGELALWRRHHWFEHCVMEPREVFLFTGGLAPGTYTYTYEAHILHAGSFEAPAPRAHTLDDAQAWAIGAAQHLTCRDAASS